jgi:type IV pilus assembly protein PilC
MEESKLAGLRALMQKAMIYPASLGLISFGVIILMVAVVIPSFMDMFVDMNMELPQATLTVMNISNFVTTNWYLILATIIISSVGIFAFANTFTGKMFFANVGLKLPLFGKLNIKTASARISRTLSTLIAAGIPR